MRTDGHMTKLMVASRSSANAHKNGRFMIMCPVSHVLRYVVTEHILVRIFAGDLYERNFGGEFNICSYRSNMDSYLKVK